MDAIFAPQLLMNIFGIIVAIFVLGILIAVHELGHLLMAKMCNIRVDTFSIGMGKPIVGFQWGETYYQLGWLPFGGFCAFGDENNSKEKDTDPRALVNSPLWGKILTIIGGSLFNIIFALLVLIILFSVGFQEKNLSNKVYVTPNITMHGNVVESPAWIAGLRSGDVIINISGQTVSHFMDIPTALAYSKQSNQTITYVRGTVTNTVPFIPINNKDTGLEIIGVRPVQEAVVGDILSDGPAVKAGLRPGDRIKMVNQKHIVYFYELEEILATNQNKQLRLEVERAGDILYLNILPSQKENVWQIGVLAENPQEILVFEKAKNFPDAVSMSMRELKTTIDQILVSLSKLFSGKINVQKNLSGPVRIVSITGTIAQTQNIVLLIRFMVMLSIALAVFNMLPIPGLDGGALVLNVLRAMFGRFPIAEKIISKIEIFGIILLLILAALVFVNDIRNIIDTKKNQTEIRKE